MKKCSLTAVNHNYFSLLIQTINIRITQHRNKLSLVARKENEKNLRVLLRMFKLLGSFMPFGDSEIISYKIFLEITQIVYTAVKRRLQ